MRSRPEPERDARSIFWLAWAPHRRVPAIVATLATSLAASLAPPAGSQERLPALRLAGLDRIEASIATRIGFLEVVARTNQVDGWALVDPARPEDEPRLSFKVNLASLDAGFAFANENLRKTFEVAKYPLATFHLERLAVREPVGRRRRTQARVVGDFTFHGVTRSVTGQAELAPAHPPGGLDARMVIPLRPADFGLGDTRGSLGIRPPETIEFRVAGSLRR